ncbi:MAG: DUF599 domain-containing protein [Betaproteobacteria bacterium]|nr:DUF599 domain-containing protein [Betaproteobacteria bacterium]
MKILSLLPWSDWLVLAFFIAAWVCYAQFATRWSQQRPSILAATNRFRLRWIQASLTRDPRVLDGIITQTLSNTPAFFSSTTILIMGGLLALMGTTDKAPSPAHFTAHPQAQFDYANRVAAMTGLAAETFNDGLRAYYFSFAVMGWFFSPMSFVVTTLLIVAILYNREFRSDVLDVLNDGN